MSAGKSVRHLTDHYNRKSVSAASWNGKGMGCVGQRDNYYLNITYWVNVQDAQKKQTELKKTDDMSDKPWFPDDDFEDLAQTLKHVRTHI